MKKITILFTLLCTTALNSMEPIEPEHGQYTGIEALIPEVKGLIISCLNTYDNLNAIIYSIRAMSMTSKTFKKIIDEKYGTPEKLETLAFMLRDKFFTQAQKLLKDYKKMHVQAYEAIDTWYKNATLDTDFYSDLGEEQWHVNDSIDEEELNRMYSNYQNGLEIQNSEPKVLYLSTVTIIQLLNTPAARKYSQNLTSKELLSIWLNVDKVKRLINDGADVNYFNNESITPLLHALKTGSPPGVIQLLLETGANPNVTDNEGKGIFEYLDIGYPQTYEIYKVIKPRIQTLLEDALAKEQG